MKTHSSQGLATTSTGLATAINIEEARNRALKIKEFKTFVELKQAPLNPPEYLELIRIVETYMHNPLVSAMDYVDEQAALEEFNYHFSTQAGYLRDKAYSDFFIKSCHELKIKQMDEVVSRFNANSLELANRINSYTQIEKFVFSRFYYLYNIHHQEGSARTTVIPSYIDEAYAGFFTDGDFAGRLARVNEIKILARTAYQILAGGEGSTLAQGSELRKVIAATLSFSNTPPELAQFHLQQHFTIVDCLSYGPIEGIESLEGALYNGTPLFSSTVVDGQKQSTKLLPTVDVTLKTGYSFQSPSEIATFPSKSEVVNKELLKGTPVSKRYPTKNIDYFEVVLKSSGLHNGKNPETFQARISVEDSKGNKRLIQEVSETGLWKGDKCFVYSFTPNANEKQNTPLIFTVERLDDWDKEDSNIKKDLSFSYISGYFKFLPSYPSIATATTVYDSDTFDKEPKRSYLVLGRKVNIPSNYDGKGRRLAEGSIWDKSFIRRWTNNPVWIIYDLLTDRDIGAGTTFNYDDIDIDSFYNAAKYCDERIVVDVNEEGQALVQPRYSCNKIIDKPQDAMKTISEITDSIWANLITTSSGKLRLIIDRPREPIFTFSNSNVLHGTFKRAGASRKTKFKRIVVSFRDEEQNFQEQKLSVEDVKNNSDYQKTKNIKLDSVTSKYEAERYAKFTLAIQRYETDTVSFAVAGLDGAYIDVGDVVNIADFVMADKDVSARVKSIENYDNQKLIKLDFIDNYFADKEAYFAFNYISSNGSFIERGTIVKGPYTIQNHNEELAIFVDDDFDQLPELGQEIAIYTEECKPEQYRILNKNLSSDGLIYQFTAQRYSREKYEIAETPNEDYAVTTTRLDQKNALSTDINFSNLAIDSVRYFEDKTGKYLTASWSDKQEGEFISYDLFIIKDGEVVKAINDIPEPSIKTPVELVNGSYILRVYKKLRNRMLLHGKEDQVAFTVNREDFQATHPIVSELRGVQEDSKMLFSFTWVDKTISNIVKEDNLITSISYRDSPINAEVTKMNIYASVNKEDLIQANLTHLNDTVHHVASFTPESNSKTIEISKEIYQQLSQLSSSSRTIYFTLRAETFGFTYSKSNIEQREQEGLLFPYVSHTYGEFLGFDLEVALSRFSPNKLKLRGQPQQPQGIPIPTSFRAGLTHYQNNYRDLDQSVTKELTLYLNDRELYRDPTPIRLASEYSKLLTNLDSFTEAIRAKVAKGVEVFCFKLAYRGGFMDTEDSTYSFTKTELGRSLQSNIDVIQNGNGVLINFVNRNLTPTTGLTSADSEFTTNGNNIATASFKHYLNEELIAQSPEVGVIAVNELPAGVHTYRLVRKTIHDIEESFSGSFEVETGAIRNELSTAIDDSVIRVADVSAVAQASKVSTAVNTIQGEAKELLVLRIPQSESYQEHFATGGWNSIAEKVADNYIYQSYEDSRKAFNLSSNLWVRLRIPVPVRGFRGRVNLSFTVYGLSYGDLSFNAGEEAFVLRSASYKSYGFSCIARDDSKEVLTLESMYYNHNEEDYIYLDCNLKQLNKMVKLGDFRISYSTSLQTITREDTVDSTGLKVIELSNKFYNIVSATATASHPDVNAFITYDDKAEQRIVKIYTRSKATGEPVGASVVYTLKGY